MLSGRTRIYYGVEEHCRCYVLGLNGVFSFVCMNARNTRAEERSPGNAFFDSRSTLGENCTLSAGGGSAPACTFVCRFESTSGSLSAGGGNLIFRSSLFPSNPLFKHIFVQLYRDQMDPDQKADNGFVIYTTTNVTF